jgi:hypothetical protein
VGICGIFSAWKIWRERTRALVKFGKFMGILVDFWGVWSG